MVACRWVLSSYLSVMPQRPEEVMSQQGQCQIWKEGEAAAKGLWGETNLTRNILRSEARRPHVAHLPTRLHIRPVHCEPTAGHEVRRRRRVNHMLLFMSLSLFVSSLSLSGAQSNGQSAPWTKGALVFSERRLLLRAAVEMSNQGWDGERCCEWDETADTSFPFIPSSDATFVTECFIYVETLSLVTCAFRPDINRGNTTHAYHANGSLWAICSAAVACSLFEPVLSASPQIYFLEGLQRETLLFRLSEVFSMWVCCDCCLYYHYSFLPAT